AFSPACRYHTGCEAPKRLEYRGVEEKPETRRRPKKIKVEQRAPGSLGGQNLNKESNAFWEGREEIEVRTSWRVLLCILGVALLAGPWMPPVYPSPQEEGQRERLLGIFREQRARRKQELTKHLAKHPKDVDAHFELGQLYALDGHVAEAIQEYRTVIEIAPDHETAYFNLGILYHRSGQLEEAIRSFRQVHRLNPTDLPTHINLGVAYRDRRRLLLRQEIEILEAAVALRPDYPEAHYHLGIAYQAMGDTERDCRPWYEKALGELQLYLAVKPSGKRHEAVSQWVELLEKRLEGC
ncbi:MAG: tetratricopeptide repeat protein, partial [Candidatus Methylomirabilales bacterium]